MPYNLYFLIFFSLFHLPYTCTDSIIGIRSNSKMGDLTVKDLQTSNLLSSTKVIQSGTIDDGIEKSPRKLSSTSTFSRNPNIDMGLVAGTAMMTTNNTAAGNSTATIPPTITVTTTDEEKVSIDGMLDRISHDLDYLLNRTTEIPTQVRRSTPANVNNKQCVDSMALPPPSSSFQQQMPPQTSAEMRESTHKFAPPPGACDIVPPPPPPPIAVPPCQPNLSVREVIEELEED